MTNTTNNLKVFTDIFKTNHWGSSESFSGPGSEMVAVGQLIKALPEIFKKYNILTMLDAPCGDYNWMKTVDKSSIRNYLGADIVPEIVEANKQKYADSKVNFTAMDITSDAIPKVDLIFCRDCLVHLSSEDALKAIANFKKSGSKYLLTTNYVQLEENRNTSEGHWRPLNLTLPPFNLPAPELTIDTNYTDGGKHYPGNGMSLWEISKI